MAKTISFFHPFPLPSDTTSVSLIHLTDSERSLEFLKDYLRTLPESVKCLEVSQSIFNSEMVKVLLTALQTSSINTLKIGGKISIKDQVVAEIFDGLNLPHLKVHSEYLRENSTAALCRLIARNTLTTLNFGGPTIKSVVDSVTLAMESNESIVSVEWSHTSYIPRIREICERNAHNAHNGSQKSLTLYQSLIGMIDL